MTDEPKPIDPKIAAEVADNSCGVAPFETGAWDPYTPTACAPHDAEYDELIQGQKTDETNLETQLDFVKNASIVAAKGLYAVVAFPVYVTVGAIGGFFRWAYLAAKTKKDGQGGA
jgi:hypothetical protein